MGLGDYPNFLSPNERHLYHVPRIERMTMSEPEGPTQFMVDMPNLELAFDATDIARLRRSEVIDLIREVDDELGDGTTTLLLYHHFRSRFEAIAAGGHPDCFLSEEALWERLEDEEARGEEPNRCLGHPAESNARIGPGSLPCDGSCRKEDAA